MIRSTILQQALDKIDREVTAALLKMGKKTKIPMTYHSLEQIKCKTLAIIESVRAEFGCEEILVAVGFRRENKQLIVHTVPSSFRDQARDRVQKEIACGALDVSNYACRHGEGGLRTNHNYYIGHKGTSYKVTFHVTTTVDGDYESLIGFDIVPVISKNAQEVTQITPKPTTLFDYDLDTHYQVRVR